VKSRKNLAYVELTFW